MMAFLVISRIVVIDLIPIIKENMASYGKKPVQIPIKTHFLCMPLQMSVIIGEKNRKEIFMLKKRNLGGLFLALVLLLSVFSQQILYAETVNETDTTDYTVIAEQLKQFSTELRPLVLAEEDNIIFSPFSYYLALLLLEPGVSGEQKELLDTVLLPDDLDRDEYFSILESFLNESMTKEHVAFQTQTYLLGGLDKTWSDDFQTSVKDLATVLKLVDFKVPATYEALNGDIAEFTKGLIDPFYSDERISELTQIDQLHLLVLNMLYFKGEWKATFNETLTSQESFYGKSEESTVDMMAQTKQFNYLETEDFQALQMKYTNGADFLIVLPKETDEPLTNEMMWQYYDKALGEANNWKKTKVQLALPKWQESASLDLTKSLDLLGLESFKDELTATSYFSEEADIFLSQISQRVEFKLDEIGTEAAAVTEIIMETTSANIDEEEPIEMIVNRPFIYRIAFSDFSLFEGVVQNLNH